MKIERYIIQKHCHHYIVCMKPPTCLFLNYKASHVVHILVTTFQPS